MSLTNPYTPKTPQEPKVFLGRIQQVEFFINAHKDVKNYRQNHFIILGEWGVGKTSLLREYKNIAQKNGAVCALIQLREVRKEDTLRDLMEYLVEQIALRLPLNLMKLKSFTKELTAGGVNLMGIGFEFSRENKRGDPQTFFYKTLLNLWQDVKKENKAIVVLIDDIQNFSTIPEVISVIKSVLSDEKIVKETKFLFVLSSTQDGWKQFLQRDHPIGRYFTPRLKLENLSEKETLELIEKNLKGTGVSFSKEVKKNIFTYTVGHLYETQVLCSHLFENQINGKVTISTFEPALKATLDVIGEEVFNQMFYSASEKEQQVLRVLAHNFEPSSFSALQTAAKSMYKLPESSVSKLVNRLIEKNLIIKPAKAKYFIPDALFREYLIRQKI
ncbi:MAG: ATP-binding protein [Candidatus Micrarchaeota archaeon]